MIRFGSRHTRDERAFTTIQYVIAVAWSLVLLVLVANLLVDVYARGAVRDALDDGVRAGAPASAVAMGRSDRRILSTEQLPNWSKVNARSGRPSSRPAGRTSGAAPS